MNVRLLRRIAKVIQEKPREFDLSKWHHVRGTSSSVHALCDLPKEKQISCITTHCIAGWAQVLSPKRDCGESAEYDAPRLLELDYEEAQRLFFGYNWPKGFGGWKATAAQAAARIEHFIKSRGRD